MSLRKAKQVIRTVLRGQLMTALGLCVACGGHAGSSADGPAPGAGGAREGALNAAGEAGDGERGGSPSLALDAGALGELGEAGDWGEAGAPEYMPFIESGTRTCQNSDYCFGLACYAPPSFLPTVCVAGCEVDADCAPDEACVHAQKLAPTCYARCGSPSDCAYHFDCFDFSGDGQLICLPAGWAGRRKELGN